VSGKSLASRQCEDAGGRQPRAIVMISPQTGHVGAPLRTVYCATNPAPRRLGGCGALGDHTDLTTLLFKQALAGGRRTSCAIPGSPIWRGRLVGPC
jgi:hypothetical protein